jgi:hypothetical protein
MNADQGYTRYKAFDAATWTTRVTAASSQLAAPAAASTSSLKGPLTSMSQTVSTATEPGTAQAGIADDVRRSVPRAMRTDAVLHQGGVRRLRSRPGALGRRVVSARAHRRLGTHASGKSTLIADFARRHPEYAVFADPFELIDESDDRPAAAMFAIRCDSRPTG